MSFDDLPENWPDLPLTDPELVSDVLDLTVSLEARRIGALIILVCDEERRLLQPIQIDHVPAQPPRQPPPFLARLATTVGGQSGLHVLVAIARGGRLHATSSDQAWRAVIESAFAGHAEVLGVHVVTRDGSIPVCAPRAA